MPGYRLLQDRAPRGPLGGVPALRSCPPPLPAPPAAGAGLAAAAARMPPLSWPVSRPRCRRFLSGSRGEGAQGASRPAGLLLFVFFRSALQRGRWEEPKAAVPPASPPCTAAHGKQKFSSSSCSLLSAGSPGPPARFPSCTMALPAPRLLPPAPGAALRFSAMANEE